MVPAGRIFLRHLIDLSMSVKYLHHHIWISREAQFDIIWWQDFLPTWSGSSLILDTHWTISPDMHLYTDASGSLGWGAFWSGHWLQAPWSLNQSEKHIVWKELFAIVNAVNTRGHLWAKQKILFHCDNQAVVDIWHRGSACDSKTMALVHLLYFCAAHYDINVVIIHISGVDNCIADFLSRFQLHRFQALAPEAHPSPDPIRAWPTPSFLHHLGSSYSMK